MSDLPIPREKRPMAAHVSLLADSARARVAQAHACWVMVDGDDSDACLTAASGALMDSSWRLSLTHRLPTFTRRLADQIVHRLSLLKRSHAELLILELSADDAPQDLKSGHAMQVLGELRRQGIVGRLGLSHPDVRALEWLIGPMPIQAMILPYGMADQAAAYRLIPKAIDAGLLCFSSLALTADDEQSLSFLLADHRLTQAIVPVLKYPWETLPQAMSCDQAETLWQQWQRHHAPPPMPESSAVPDGVG